MSEDKDKEEFKIGIRSIEGYVLFVRNFDLEIEEEDVFELFSEYGLVTKVVLNLSRESGFLMGYCLVQMKDRESCLKAIEGLNGKKYRNKILTVDWAFKSIIRKKRKIEQLVDKFLEKDETEEKKKEPELKKQKTSE